MLHAQAKPPAFLISDITVTDDAKFKEWGGRVVATFVTHGTKYLARLSLSTGTLGMPREAIKRLIA
jgi:uncharacterized protein (DUF1330 family)